MTLKSASGVAALAIAGMLLAISPAQAGEVLVVGAGKAKRVDRPFVPERAGSDLPAPALAPRPRAAAAIAGRQGLIARRARRARFATSTRKGHRAVQRSLRRARRAGRISRAAYTRYRRQFRRARIVTRRLRGARKREMRGVLATTEAMALRRQLTAPRMRPVFLILHRNTRFWPAQPFPRDRDHVSFRGSRLIYEYYSGSGLQLQPLVNFKQANLMHGACVKETGELCDRAGLRRLLNELIATSARRGGMRTWEYYFTFGGGSPPWISGMAQATAAQAFARAWQLLGYRRFLTWGRASLRVFDREAPVGVRTDGPLGGPHYLQYSFSPGLYITNAFLQALIGLYDFSEITGNRTARRLFDEAEAEAIDELERSDIGDWSTYSFSGAESTREYHELLREFAASLCSRLRRPAYCRTARSFADYMTDPAELELLGPETVVKGRPVPVRFDLSKLSAVQITITRAGKLALDRTVTFRRGQGSFTWKPRAVGIYSVRLAAKELRTGLELRTYARGRIASTAP